MIVLVRYRAGSQILAKSSSELLRHVEKRSSEKASTDLHDTKGVNKLISPITRLEGMARN
jgi:hypothetical protein